MKHPVTQAVRFLRANKIEFRPHVYRYVENGGAAHSAAELGVDEHSVVKTLVFETTDRVPLLVLQHGDREVSAKTLARHLGAKSVAPVSPERATRLTGYLVGGTSPFGTKTKLRIHAESTIFDLERIYINGGKRGFLIEIEPRVLVEVLGAERVEVGR